QAPHCTTISSRRTRSWPACCRSRAGPDTRYHSIKGKLMNLSFLRPLALAAALGLGMLGSAGAAQYSTLDGEASTLAFGYSQMNVKMDGRFAALRATELSFDPARPEAAKVSIEVALSGIDAGYDEANTELAKDEWLALAAHPLATFTSTGVEALGDNRYQVTGELSIKGVTRTVTAPFT